MLYEFRKGISDESAKKSICKVYLDHAETLRRVKRNFGRCRQGKFNLNDQTHSRRPSGFDEDALLAIVEDKMSKEGITKSFKNNISAAYRNWKITGYVSIIDTCWHILWGKKNKLNLSWIKFWKANGWFMITFGA